MMQIYLLKQIKSKFINGEINNSKITLKSDAIEEKKFKIWNRF